VLAALPVVLPGRRSRRVLHGRGGSCGDGAGISARLAAGGKEFGGQFIVQ